MTRPEIIPRSLRLLVNTQPPCPMDYIYIFIWSYHAISMDIPDPLSPLVPIDHCFRQVTRAKSRIGTELLYVGSRWSSCLCTFMWRGAQEYITNEFVPTSSEVSRMSGSSNFGSFRNGWLVPCGVLSPGLLQYFSQYSCVVAVKLFSIRLVRYYEAVSTQPLLGRNCASFWSVRSDLHMTDSLSLDIHAVASRVSMSASFDETLLPIYIYIYIYIYIR